mmetsp:Transcript_43164/g.111901  ORF Transcript_43164/g.111901 Transcript_43164/m.111901 type:complete len:254 (-) Transcript_43164:1887-2648(-)
MLLPLRAFPPASSATSRSSGSCIESSTARLHLSNAVIVRMTRRNFCDFACVPSLRVMSPLPFAPTPTPLLSDEPSSSMSSSVISIVASENRRRPSDGGRTSLLAPPWSCSCPITDTRLNFLPTLLFSFLSSHCFDLALSLSTTAGEGKKVGMVVAWAPSTRLSNSSSFSSSTSSKLGTITRGFTFAAMLIILSSIVAALLTPSPSTSSLLASITASDRAYRCLSIPSTLCLCSIFRRRLASFTACCGTFDPSM